MSEKDFDNYFGLSGESHTIIGKFEYSPIGFLWTFETWLDKEDFKKELPSFEWLNRSFEIVGEEFKAIRYGELSQVFNDLEIAIFDILGRAKQSHELDVFRMNVTARTMLVKAHTNEAGFVPSLEVLPDKFDAVRSQHQTIVEPCMRFMWGYAAQRDAFIAKLVQRNA